MGGISNVHYSMAYTKTVYSSYVPVLLLYPKRSLHIQTELVLRCIQDIAVVYVRYALRKYDPLRSTLHGKHDGKLQRLGQIDD